MRYVINADDLHGIIYSLDSIEYFQERIAKSMRNFSGFDSDFRASDDVENIVKNHLKSLSMKYPATPEPEKTSPKILTPPLSIWKNAPGAKHEA